MGELYQLIAIYEDGSEQIIELKNDNKNNKAHLSFIDSGTTYMASERELKEYLFRKGKINSLDVTFVIKYSNRGTRYLPIIYNNPELRELSRVASKKEALESFARYLIDKIDFELCRSDFYDNILELNDVFDSQITNGNYLNNHDLNELRKFYEAFGGLNEERYYKEKYKKELAHSISSYKTLRTLVIFYDIHLKCKLNKRPIEDNREYDIPEHLKYQIMEESENFVDTPEHLQRAYEQGGMDAVWALADSDEVLDTGYKFK